MRILICDKMFPAMSTALEELLSGDTLRTCLSEQTQDEAPWAEVLIPSMTRITARIIETAPDLKLIQQFGVGLEGVDIRAAEDKGIPVANVPGNQAQIHAECTAEGGLFLMMACARRLKGQHQPGTGGQRGRPA